MFLAASLLMGLPAFHAGFARFALIDSRVAHHKKTIAIKDCMDFFMFLAASLLMGLPAFYAGFARFALIDSRVAHHFPRRAPFTASDKSDRSDWSDWSDTAPPHHRTAAPPHRRRQVCQAEIDFQFF